MNTCSLHSYGYSIKYGNAITAYHAGCDTICTVRFSLRNVFDLPDSSSFTISNWRVCLPRTGSGSDSITRMRRLNTGRKPSSPSLSLSVAPTALYVRKFMPSATLNRHEKLRDSFDGMSNASSFFLLPSPSSTDFCVRASARVSITLPVWRAAD